MMRKFAISDIHGCAKSFRALVENVLKLRPEDELYLLGDYVDRGSDSRAVFDFIWELQEHNFQVKCLSGNHEVMLLNARDGGDELELWLANGGRATLKSFGAKNVEDIPAKYLDYISSLDYFFEIDEYILVHAGINMGVEKPLEHYQDMLWLRWWYDEIDYGWLKNRIIVHGHTPISQRDIRQMLHQISQTQVLDIDNGCFVSTRYDMGTLCAFELMHRQLYFQENVD